MSKSGDNISKENASWNFKGDVVKKSDNHVSKSVPIYNRGHDLIIQLSDFFIKEDSLVYDLGCSTGKLLINLVGHNKHKINSKFILYFHNDLPGYKDLQFVQHFLLVHCLLHRKAEAHNLLYRYSHLYCIV